MTPEEEFQKQLRPPFWRSMLKVLQSQLVVTLVVMLAIAVGIGAEVLGLYFKVSIAKAMGWL